MDLRLSKEEELIQKAARDFADKMIVPIAELIDQDNHIPEEIFEALGDLEMFGIPFPEAYGGGEAGYLSYILAIEELAKACAGIAVVISVNSVGLSVINAFGTEEQKKKYMPECMTGKKIFSFAFTEPGTGSDPKQLSCTVTKAGDSYILNGNKRFITNAGFQGPMVVIAKDSETDKASAFVIDKFCEGYSLSEQWNKIGAHGGPLYDVYFDNVKIPEGNVLGRSGEGLWVLKVAMIYGKIGLSGLFLGTAKAAYEEALAYAKQKTHRGQPIGAKFQHIQISIADMAMKYNACRWSAYNLGFTADTVKDPNQLLREAALTKVFVSETAVEICKIAMGVHGSYGLMKDYKIARLWGDVIIGPQVEGTSPLLKILAAGIILGD